MQRLGVVSTTILSATVNAGAETVICTVGPLVTSYDSQSIFLIGELAGILNAITSYLLQIRRGSAITGTLVSNGIADTRALAGGNTGRFLCTALDTPPASGPQFYSLTATPTGANTSVQGVSLAAFLL